MLLPFIPSYHPTITAILFYPLFTISGDVTAIATSSENPDMILTASRDKTIIMWTLTRDDVRSIPLAITFWARGRTSRES